MDRENKLFSPNEDSQYKDQYRWQTRGLPELEEYSKWYDSGEKVWPNDIELTPLTLTHWYCGDGTYSRHGTNDYISIGVSNELQNKLKVNKMFRNSNLPEPDRWVIDGRKAEIAWNKKNSHALLEYMDGSLPGYEYKWGEL